jgi:hypothetical protein
LAFAARIACASFSASSAEQPASQAFHPFPAAYRNLYGQFLCDKLQLLLLFDLQHAFYDRNRHAGACGDGFHDIFRIDDVAGARFAFTPQLDACSRFVDQIDCAIRQMTVSEKPARGRNCRLYGLIRDHHAMKLLILRLYSRYDPNGSSSFGGNTATTSK